MKRKTLPQEIEFWNFRCFLSICCHLVLRIPFFMFTAHFPGITIGFFAQHGRNFEQCLVEGNRPPRFPDISVPIGSYLRRPKQASGDASFRCRPLRLPFITRRISTIILRVPCFIENFEWDSTTRTIQVFFFFVRNITNVERVWRNFRIVFMSIGGLDARRADCREFPILSRLYENFFGDLNARASDQKSLVQAGNNS